MSEIAVMGATGHTGSVIARNLLALGHRVRAMGRSAERLESLRQQGAQLHVGNCADAAYLERAFGGADAVYAMMPFDPTAPGFMALQRTQGQAIVSALQAARVPHVVALSSLGAEQPTGTGVLVSLHEQEQRLAALQHSHVLKLRPAMFFEGLFNLLPGVKYGGSLADAFAPDLPIPMIATRDIADAATAALDQRGWTGHRVRELLGPGDLSHNQLATLVGGVIGQPALAYQQLPYESAAQGMAQAGIAPDLADLLAEMARALNEGRVRTVEGRNAGNTTPTPLQALGPALKAAYEALP
ncbi:uncharacterized protein YbjT (DUF2867 family) [Acidovorax soli]|uniref:Uncharacterized protein YbjT (DUF2867 family) n=1 Tax=Acidovorax soli TaxID=592050 RepID=A0A7X0PAW9_9BURK|nr:NmrA family NAD(P)-binding protein [Acidovorax soli]MBB6558289.1 uncharacterized protein YbjT (DUF2867 family) [Acidovorax soli]